MRNTKSDIVAFKEYFGFSGGEVVHHGRQKVGELQAAWKEKLAQTQKQRRLLDQFLWHAFSYECVPCRKGFRAREEIARQRDRHYFIWTASDGLGALEFQNQPIPSVDRLEKAWEVNSHLADLYVAAANGNWLYALTHERNWDLGPYFVSAEWCHK